MQQRKQQHKSMHDMQLKWLDTPETIYIVVHIPTTLGWDASIVVMQRIFFLMIGGCVEEDDAHYLCS